MRKISLDEQSGKDLCNSKRYIIAAEIDIYFDGNDDNHDGTFKKIFKSRATGLAKIKTDEGKVYISKDRRTPSQKVRFAIENFYDSNVKVQDRWTREGFYVWAMGNFVHHIVSIMILLSRHFRTYDCEDYALALRDDAYSKGFHMNIQAVWDYRRPDTGELITEYNEGHAVNSTIIGNEMYFIEPQTDEYWLATYLD